MNSETANYVKPATEDEIAVTSVTAGAASSAIPIETIKAAAYVTISIDAGAGAGPTGCYLTRKNGAAPTDPNPTATSGGGRTQWYDAADLRALVFAPGDQVKVYVPGSGTYYVRQSPASPA